MYIYIYICCVCVYYLYIFDNFFILFHFCLKERLQWELDAVIEEESKKQQEVFKLFIVTLFSSSKYFFLVFYAGLKVQTIYIDCVHFIFSMKSSHLC